MNGKLLYRRTRRNGKLEVSIISNIKRSVKAEELIVQGEEKRWFSNGQLSGQWTWKNQQIIGEDKGYYSNGKVKLLFFLRVLLCAARVPESDG